jgi:hypothetical protein
MLSPKAVTTGLGRLWTLKAARQFVGILYSMRNISSSIQPIAITSVCVLLAAKFPSFAEHQDSGFSLKGALFGGGIAFIALSIGTHFSSKNDGFVASGTTLQMHLIRGALISACAAAVSFTAMLYFPASKWIATAVGISVVGGAICVFGGLVSRLVVSQEPDA